MSSTGQCDRGRSFFLLQIAEEGVSEVATSTQPTERCNFNTEGETCIRRGEMT